MTYFDTDVLVNATVRQDLLKYNQANDLIEQASLDDKFLISWLSVQEMGFVLARLQEPTSEIVLTLNSLVASLPVSYGAVEIQRAIELATIIGFKHFNDCFHTAIAEQHCTDLYTYNQQDFKRIQPHTNLMIHLL